MSTPARKPDRADVCIIGAGATGATAAKVLTEAGRRVVALEKGPWRTKETFGGDELANVTVPTSVIEAPLDPVTPPAQAQHLAQQIPGAGLVSIPTMGHALPLPLMGQLADAVLGMTLRLGA